MGHTSGQVLVSGWPCRPEAAVAALVRYDGVMDSDRRARSSSGHSASRIPKQRRALRLAVFLGLAVLVVIGLALASRRNRSPQTKPEASGVWLAQRRAGEIPPGERLPSVATRAREASAPSSPTSLPMPDVPHRTPSTPNVRFVISESPPPHPASGHLYVDTQPASQVWIDDELRGKTPLDVKVNPGPRRLRLEADGYRAIRETFSAEEGAIIRRALLPAKVR